MKTSIIILTYNQQDFVRESLLSAIMQDEPPSEIVVSDDCSTDSTLRILDEIKKDYRHLNIIILSSKKNLGIVKNLNKAFKQVNGDLILLQAGDDFSSPNRLRLTKKYFSENKKCQIAISSYRDMDEKNLRLLNHIRRGGKVELSIKQFIKKNGGISPFGMALRKSFFDEFGNLCEILRNEDDQLIFRGLIKNSVYCIPEVLYEYRIHIRSISGFKYLGSYKNYKKEFIFNLANNLENSKEFLRLLVAHCPNEKELIALSNLKIQLMEFLQKFESLKFTKKILCILKYYKIISIKDLILLTLGNNGIYLIRFLQKIVR